MSPYWEITNIVMFIPRCNVGYSVPLGINTSYRYQELDIETIESLPGEVEHEECPSALKYGEDVGWLTYTRSFLSTLSPVVISPSFPVCLSRIILVFCLRSLPGKCTLTQGEPVKVVNWGQSLISVLIDPETFRKRSASLEHSPQSVGNPR